MNETPKNPFQFNSINPTKLKSQLGEIFFLAVFIVLPFKLILSPISLGLLFVWYIVFGDKNRVLKKLPNVHWHFVVFYIFFLVQLASAMFSDSLYQNSQRLLTQSPLFIIPLLFALISPSKELIDKAKKMFILSCTLFCLYSFSTLFYNYLINYEHRLNYNFVQRSLYHFHFPYDVLYLNVAFAFLLFSNLKIKPALKPAITIIFFLFIIASGVRIGIFTFLLICMLFAVLNFKKIANLKTVFLAVLLVVSAIAVINSSTYTKDKILGTLEKAGLDTGRYVSEIGEKYHKITLREKLWFSSIEAIKEKPIFGYGAKGAQNELNKLFAKKGFDNLINLNSHNQYLTSAIETGLVGLFFLGLIFIVALVSSVKMKSLSNGIVVLIFAIAFFTESVLVRQKGVVFFSMVFSIIIIEYAHWKNAKKGFVPANL